ncbi:MAG: hypothetical protein NTZ05_04495 [Chloroflexi bacterium]|nr:hypothetical protein [Chloroflexota bacterium]
MNRLQAFGLLAAGVLTLAAIPSSLPATVAVSAAPLIPAAEIMVPLPAPVTPAAPKGVTQVDAPIWIASRGGVPSPTAAPQNSGAGVEVIGVKCIVKFFKPIELATRGRHGRHDGHDDTIILSQDKLICTDTIGASEVVIEQNDRLVVGGTTFNDQTPVTLHSLTTKLNREQEDNFCLGVGVLTSGIVAQQCDFNLGR